MKILVIAPMQVEALYFNRALASLNKKKNTYKVITAGIGKVDAAVSAALELYDSNADYDLVVDIGFAAGSSVYNQGDLVIPCACRYHDTVVPPGLCPNLDKDYQTQGDDESICLTGDSFVDKGIAERLIKKYGKWVIFDMEAAAIAQVCDDLEMPFLLIKIISDIPQESGLQSFTDFVNEHQDFSQIVGYLELLS